MKRPCLRLCFAVMIGFGFAIGGMPAAGAQESDSDEFVLEEIIVTAQKRAENQQKVAISMEVITGEDLGGTEKDNVDDILRDFSNVMINKMDDGMRITLRGLGDDDFLTDNVHTSSPSVAVNIDGAYNNESSAGQNLFDLERVEVLAGPQSTMYGSNSPGGVVNVVTASPKADRFSTSASAELGNYGLFDGQLTLNVPVIQDLLAMRLAGHWYKRDSWIEGNTNEQDNKTVRLKTKIEPSDTFDATVTLNYSENASGGRLNGQVRLFDYEDGHYEDGTPVKNPWTSADWESSSVGSDDVDALGSTAETTGIQAEINWDTALGAISFVPSYSERKSTDVSGDVEIIFAGDDTTYHTTQESENSNAQQGADLRITSPEDFPFKWIVGGTWLDSEADAFTNDLYYDSNDEGQVFTQENRAVYANITYPLTDRFRGTVGYRYSWDKVENLQTGGKWVDGKLWGQEYEAPDYKLGVEYDLSENSMAWADWSTSYKVDPMAAESSQGAEAQILESYSVGVKNRFLDNKLQLNATAFYYDYRNKWFKGGQQSRFNPGTVVKESDYPHEDPDTGEWLPGTDFNYDGDYVDTNLSEGLLPGESSDLVGYTVADYYSKQYGALESFGVDVSVNWVPTAKDRVNLQVSYLDSEWTDAVCDFYWSWVWPDQGLNFNGSPATLSPEWTVNASYEHRFELGSIGSLIPQIDVQYKSEYFLSFNRVIVEGAIPDPIFPDPIYYNPPWSRQEPHYMLNGSVSFNHSSDKWSLRAYMKNATDYAAKNAYGGHTDIKLGISDPRTYGAVLSVKY